MNIQLKCAIGVCSTVLAAKAGVILISSGSGVDPASITVARDAFRTAIGGGTVAGANGSFGGVRREINWDGVPDGFSDPNNLPSNFFNVNSPRGVVFSTTGTGFLTSANSGLPTPTLFSGLDPSYAGAFRTFSSQRVFGVSGSNEMIVDFFVPGTATPASVGAFGVVFVDNTGTAFPNCASIQAFNGASSLGFFCAPAAPAGGLSFLGLSATGGDVITSVKIHLGTGALGTAQSSTNEIVVMDDFLYSEPAAVPEPATAVLTLAGLIAGAAVVRRRRVAEIAGCRN